MSVDYYPRLLIGNIYCIAMNCAKKESCVDAEETKSYLVKKVDALIMFLLSRIECSSKQ